MRHTRTILAALAASSLVVMSGDGSFAQDKEGGADVVVPMGKQAELSPEEMVDQADVLLRRMQDVLKRVVQLKEIARKQKDVLKLNCVNDKLLQVKQLLNISEAAKTNLVEAIAQEDEEGRYHEYGKINLAAEQVQILGQEAEQCIGEELIYLGPTEVTVEEPENPDDPDDGLDDFDFDRPGYASPFG